MNVSLFIKPYAIAAITFSRVPGLVGVVKGAAAARFGSDAGQAE
jgi:hypothetical protein